MIQDGSPHCYCVRALNPKFLSGLEQENCVITGAQARTGCSGTDSPANPSPLRALTNCTDTSGGGRYLCSIYLGPKPCKFQGASGRNEQGLAISLPLGFMFWENRLDAVPVGALGRLISRSTVV